MKPPGLSQCADPGVFYCLLSIGTRPKKIEMELTLEQILIVGTIASVATQVLKIISEKV